MFYVFYRFLVLRFIGILWWIFIIVGEDSIVITLQERIGGEFCNIDRGYLLFFKQKGVCGIRIRENQYLVIWEKLVQYISIMGYKVIKYEGFEIFILLDFQISNIFVIVISFFVLFFFVKNDKIYFKNICLIFVVILYVD